MSKRRPALRLLFALGLTFASTAGAGARSVDSYDRNVKLHFRVLDQETKQPLANVEVTVSNANPEAHGPPTKAITDGFGHVAVDRTFPVIPGKHIWNRGTCDFAWSWLDVRKDGYKSFKAPLDTAADCSTMRFGRRDTPIVVSLQKGEDKPKSRPRAEGVYGYSWHCGGCMLTITGEGVFWMDSYGRGDSDCHFGVVEEDGGWTILKPARPEWNKYFDSGRKRYILAGRPTQRYLQAEGDIKHFCNVMNGYVGNWKTAQIVSGPNGLFRNLTDLRALPSNGNSIGGKPELPAQFRSMLLPHPIHGKVVGVWPDHTATINLGANVGVWEGMEVHCFDSVTGDRTDAVVQSVYDTETLVDYWIHGAHASLRVDADVGSAAEPIPIDPERIVRELENKGGKTGLEMVPEILFLAGIRAGNQDFPNSQRLLEKALTIVEESGRPAYRELRMIAEMHRDHRMSAKPEAGSIDLTRRISELEAAWSNPARASARWPAVARASILKP